MSYDINADAAHRSDFNFDSASPPQFAPDFTGILLQMWRIDLAFRNNPTTTLWIAYDLGQNFENL